LLFLIHI